jgi:hypothetical protein
MGMPLEAASHLFELYEHEGDVTRMAKALRVFRQEIRSLERRRDEVGQTIAMLQAQTERLSDARAERSAIEEPGPKAAKLSRPSAAA